MTAMSKHKSHPPAKPSNPHVISWVDQMATLCQPDDIVWCDGSEEEKQVLTAEAVAKGILIELNQKKLPGCYYHRSHPNDVARAEHCTYICTPKEEEAGPTNNWAPPQEMYRKLHRLASGGMRGRTMYVVPYLMGPLGSPLAKVGVELTDSLYVVLSMRIMTRMGSLAWEQLGSSSDFTRGLHCMVDINPDRRYIAISPRTTPSSPSAPLTAAMPCSARNASPCASVPIWAESKAGWPSTC